MKTYRIILHHRWNEQWEDNFPWVMIIDDDGKVIYFTRDIAKYHYATTDTTLDTGINLTSGDDYWAGLTWSQLPISGYAVEFKWKNPVSPPPPATQNPPTQGDSVDISFYAKSKSSVDDRSAWQLDDVSSRSASRPITVQNTHPVRKPLLTGLNELQLTVRVTVGSNEIEVIHEGPGDRWEIIIEEVGRPTASPYVDTEDIMFWLKGTNSKLEATDSFPEAKVASDKVIPFLESKMDTSKWTNKANTPDIVCNAIAQLAAAYRYNVYNTETMDDGGSNYTRKLERDAWACLQDVREGFIDLDLPIDKYSYATNTPYFTMSQEF